MRELSDLPNISALAALMRRGNPDRVECDLCADTLEDMAMILNENGLLEINTEVKE